MAAQSHHNKALQAVGYWFNMSLFTWQMLGHECINSHLHQPGDMFVNLHSVIGTQEGSCVDVWTDGRTGHMRMHKSRSE